jgi:hypothetical protein
LTRLPDPHILTEREKMKVILTVCICLFIACLAPVFAESPALAFSPREWQFGTIPPGTRAFLTLHVKNLSDKDVTVSVLPTCDCLSTGPSKLVIRPGAQGVFRFSFLAEEDERGPVKESYIIQTSQKGLEFFYYKVSGVIEPKMALPGNGSTPSLP